MLLAGFFAIQSFSTQKLKNARKRSSRFESVRGEPAQVFRKSSACSRPKVADVAKVFSFRVVLEERPQEPVFRDGALVQISRFAIGEERVECVADGDDLRRFRFVFASLNLADDLLCPIERTGLQRFAGMGLAVKRPRRPQGTAAFPADAVIGKRALLFVAPVDGEHKTPLTQSLYKIVYSSMRRIRRYLE